MALIELAVLRELTVLDKISLVKEFEQQTSEAKYRWSRKTAGEQELILAWPTGYMNHSGEAARELLKDHNLMPAEMLVIVDDFNRFISHYALHRIPELWEFHKVHHSAEVLNFTTADRVHPFEVVFSGLVNGITIGVVNGFYIGFFGGELTVATVAEKTAVYRQADGRQDPGPDLREALDPHPGLLPGGHGAAGGRRGGHRRRRKPPGRQ